MTLSAGAALFAVAEELVNGGPSPRFCGFSQMPFFSWPAPMCAACRFCFSV